MQFINPKRWPSLEEQPLKTECWPSYEELPPWKPNFYHHLRKWHHENQIFTIIWGTSHHENQKLTIIWGNTTMKTIKFLSRTLIAKWDFCSSTLHRIQSVSLFCLFTVETVKCCCILPVSIFLYNFPEICAALFPGSLIWNMQPASSFYIAFSLS